jgi:YVTN family beta-propeller protein
MVGGLAAVAASPPASSSIGTSTIISISTVSSTSTSLPGTPPGISVVVRQPTQRVVIQVHPPTATISFAAADMATLVTKSGATVRLPIGKSEMTIEATGFQLIRQTVVIGPNTRLLERRLDPNRQLHRHRWDARTGSNPKQVSFTPDGSELWVPLLGSRGVDVFRTADGLKLTTIDLGNKFGAVEVIFNRDGTRAYVSQMQTASVIEVDTQSKKLIRTMATGGNWTKVLALSPDELTLYAANWVSNDVSVIDLATGRLIRRISTVRTPRGLALDPSGERLFVAGFEGGEIQRITLKTDNTKVLLRTGGAMRHMVLDPESNLLYADDMGTSQTYVLDLKTEQTRLLGRVDSHPNTIDLSADHRFLYTSNRGANNKKGYNLPGPEWGTVLVLDVRTGQPVDAIIGGNQTTGLDVSPDGRWIAFTDFLDNRLALYEVPTAEVLENGQGGLAPTRRRLLVK